MRLLDAWCENPVDATTFASNYKLANPDVDLSKRQIADVLRRTIPYALYKKPIADKATTTTQYEHIRGGLCMADSTVLKKGFNGVCLVRISGRGCFQRFCILRSYTKIECSFNG